MFEHRSEPVLSRALFGRRLARTGGLAAGILAVALGLGMLGYRLLAGLGWADAAFNAAMVLAGMGHVDQIETTAGRLFAGFFALFGSIVFLGIAGILVAPWAHRLLHRFHADPDEERGRRR